MKKSKGKHTIHISKAPRNIEGTIITALLIKGRKYIVVGRLKDREEDDENYVLLACSLKAAENRF